MSAIRQAPVGCVAVGQEDAANGGVVPDEGMEAFAVDVDDPLQTAPNRVLPIAHLDRTDHENLPDGASALAAALRIALATELYARLVDLNDARERRPLWRYHGSAELLEEKPSCLVAAEPKLRLELEGGHAIRMRR